jgi:hypothetical protein
MTQNKKFCELDHFQTVNFLSARLKLLILLNSFSKILTSWLEDKVSYDIWLSYRGPPTYVAWRGRYDNPYAIHQSGTKNLATGVQDFILLVRN